MRSLWWKIGLIIQFLHILGNFWYLVVTLVAFSSNIINTNWFFKKRKFWENMSQILRKYGLVNCFLIGVLGICLAFMGHAVQWNDILSGFSTSYHLSGASTIIILQYYFKAYCHHHHHHRNHHHHHHHHHDHHLHYHHYN